MTDEQKVVQKAIEDLLRLAGRSKVAVCGFAFAAEPPMIVNFGNCTDAHDLKLYSTLVKMCEEKRKHGEAEQTVVGDVV